MARPILSEYGPNAPKRQAARATSGGIKEARDVNSYQKPQGPTSIGNRKVGLGGTNYGNTPGFNECPKGGSGSPGLGGRNLGPGVNRKG